MKNPEHLSFKAYVIFEDTKHLNKFCKFYSFLFIFFHTFEK